MRATTATVFCHRDGAAGVALRECWLSHVCTGGRQNKAQKMWLVSGLQDHRYLYVKI